MLRYTASRATAFTCTVNRRHRLHGVASKTMHSTGPFLWDIQEVRGNRVEAAARVTMLVRQKRRQWREASFLGMSSSSSSSSSVESTHPPTSITSREGSHPSDESSMSPPFIPRSISSDASTVVVKNIHHCCATNETFFHSTVRNLNLPLLSHDDNDNDNDKLRIELARQYRQLYHQSLPPFRTHLLSERGPPGLRSVWDDLLAVGLGDPSFSKRFRAVRSYESRKEKLERMRRQRKEDLQQIQRSIQKARRELETQKEAARISAQEQRASMVHRFKPRRQQQQQPSSPPPPPAKGSTLPLLSTWSRLVSWLVGGRREESRTARSVPATVDVPESQDYYEPFSPPSNRARIRVSAKVQAVASLQQDLEVAREDLTKLDIAVLSLHFPLPIPDYQLAVQALEKHREAICHELAQLIYKREADLIEQFQLLDSKTDLTKPWDWFGSARRLRRKIIFHSGPTNSGKTYRALERLKEANEGLYLAPLRLLAAEVYDDLTSQGISTNLYTGQERRDVPLARHTAATVEMASMDRTYDIVVMDEIQMVADASRGAAWTKALLGLRCLEIHVCGGSEARNIVRKLAKACGDDFELQEYERFSPLKIASRSFARDGSKSGCYRHVKPGDCVVAFSRNDIFAIKLEIEKTTAYKCCVIYGTLPPEIRAEEARRFNDPDSGYDILVASDAIGMGLNLSIKRVIFHSIFKYNGEKVIRLSHSEIKQISGRAGRRNSLYPHGVVTCRDPRDLPYIRQCLQSEIPQIKKAALLPTSAHIEVFRDGIEVYGVGEEFVDLHNILKQFRAMATVNNDLFFLGCQAEMQMIAEKLQGIPLSLKDAYTLCLSPSSEKSMVLLQNFAKKSIHGELCGLPSRPIPKPAKSVDDISSLCNLYGEADLYLWLQFKFLPTTTRRRDVDVDIDIDQHEATALARKKSLLQLIHDALANADKLTLHHDYIQAAIRHRRTWETENALNNSGSSSSSYDADDDTEDEDDDDEEYLALSKTQNQSYV